METQINTKNLVNQKSLLTNLDRFLKAHQLLVDYNRKDSFFQISQVDLKDQYGQTVCSGRGRGPNHHVGALAEAIENYLLLKNNDQVSKIRKSTKIVRQPFIESDEVLNHLLNLKNEERIKTVSFKRIQNSQDSIEVPALYINPFEKQLNGNSFQESLIKKYSSRCGIGVGATFEDSLLHGVYECIERHALSSLFFQIAVSNDKIQNWKMVHLNSTNENMIKNKIEQKFGGKVYCLIGSYFETTVSVAFLVLDEGHCFFMPQVTSSCSVFPKKSILSALNELLQVCLLYDANNFLKDKKAFHLLTQYPKLKNLYFPNHDLFDRLSVQSRLDGDKVFLNSKDELNHVCSQLECEGYYPFSRTLESQFLKSTQVFVPQFDRFYLIRSGIPVVPQKELAA